MFQLWNQEVEDLRSQFATSNEGRGGRRYRPFAFTEQGVAMLASVLQSKEAALINFQIVRAFVAMREAIATSAELARKLEQFEYRLGQHDDDIASLFEAIKQLMALPLRKGRSRL
jgi:phage regulator Rha-like protein